MLTQLDHIALVVRDLSAATEHYSTLLGCAPNWHGTDGGAEHVWFQLNNMALDIIAPIGTGYTGDRVQAQLDRHGEGIWAIAFATADIAKTRHVLERRGITSTDAQSIRSTHVENKEQRYWTTSVLSPESTRGATIFLVEQKPDAIPWPVSPSTTETKAAVSGLDHVVITTPQPERAAALYGARLGLEMKLDRTNPDWGSRLMFFKCSDLIIEVAHDLKKGVTDGPDHVWGLSWRVPDIAVTQARLAAAGFNVSDVRTGRKPGTSVFTVRDRNASVPTIVIGRV
jgi:catechol 2,3-dioxygenase-like lactoylglutathione lyase family enzyme